MPLERILKSSNISLEQIITLNLDTDLFALHLLY